MEVKPLGDGSAHLPGSVTFIAVHSVLTCVESATVRVYITEALTFKVVFGWTGRACSEPSLDLGRVLGFN